MSKRTKKQPYRNTLLKLKKERSSLISLYKENQRLNASTLYKQKEAQTLLKSAAQEKEQVELLRNEVLNELKQYNPYHTALCSSIEVQNITIDDGIAAPQVDWNDTQKAGTVRIVCHKQPDRYETVAFGISAAHMKNCERYISEDIVDTISKKIATDLIELATTKMKEW